MASQHQNSHRAVSMRRSRSGRALRPRRALCCGRKASQRRPWCGQLYQGANAKREVVYWERIKQCRVVMRRAGICGVRANESIAGQVRFALRISWGGRTEAWPSGHEKKTRKAAWLACARPTLCAHGANGTMPSLRRWFWARLNVGARRVAADLLLWRRARAWRCAGRRRRAEARQKSWGVR